MHVAAVGVFTRFKSSADLEARESSYAEGNAGKRFVFGGGAEVWPLEKTVLGNLEEQ